MARPSISASLVALVVALIGASAASPSASADASRPTLDRSPKSAFSGQLAKGIRGAVAMRQVEVPRELSRKGRRRRAPLARAAAFERNVEFTCSYTSGTAQIAVGAAATFGARVGESVRVRAWFHVWSPTKDFWRLHADYMHRPIPGAVGGWTWLSPLTLAHGDFARGDWVSAWLQTYSPTTGWQNWSLAPIRVEPSNIAFSLARVSGEWCQPFPY